MIETLVDFLGILIILVTFEILNQSYVKPMINSIALQSILLAILIGILGVFRHSIELIALSILTLMVRGLLIPWIIRRDIRNNPIWDYREVETRVPSLTLAGILLAIVGYVLYQPLHSILNVKSGVLAIVLLLLSFLIMIARKNAFAQLVGYISEENALLYVSVLTNLPMVFEAGVLLDLLGIVLVGIILAAEKEYGYVELEKLVG